MHVVLPDLIRAAAAANADAPALLHREQCLSYGDLADRIERAAAGMRALGLERDDRVAVYLPKVPECVVALFAASLAGGVFVPVNPVLKPHQVGHILRDCNARLLVTSAARAAGLSGELDQCPDLRHVVDIDAPAGTDTGITQRTPWSQLIGQDSAHSALDRIESDMASILYTSGSTGRPKGVVLSHRNMLSGAQSVASYLGNVSQDRLLAALPFSFDYGLSQLTTAFHAGASVALIDYLLPRDIVNAVVRHGVTGLAGVPPLWNQLARLEWPAAARATLRYLTNSGGAMPLATTRALRAALPEARLYLMYGLTEAFRSTYLPPEHVDTLPHSMGQAIPNAEVMVVREDGSECAPGETGELVHRGPLVALGYWNDPERTAERFRPAPGRPAGLPRAEIAVWSGDRVRRDEHGWLYFVGRNDEMIKSSGYRISPTEIEEVVYRYDGVDQVAAIGVPHPELGQGIVLAVQYGDAGIEHDALLAHCRSELPAFMVPHRIELRAELPRNPNGKIDRAALAREFHDALSGEDVAS